MDANFIEGFEKQAASNFVGRLGSMAASAVNKFKSIGKSSVNSAAKPVATNAT